MAGQKKTSFDGMTHEQMLAWLDAADAGTVQAAADKLASAAKEIHSIADELKVRPQWVKWKGEGADSFRQWAGKLANATVALGDYSQESSKWLGHAAQAISKAKTSVPRDENVDANIDAARSAHNDPDSQTILSKNMAIRQQTADELDKLGQAYSLSTSQMAAARKPDLLKFPPPPKVIQDPAAGQIYGDGEDLAAEPGRSTTGGSPAGGQARGTVTGPSSAPTMGHAEAAPVTGHAEARHVAVEPGPTHADPGSTRPTVVDPAAGATPVVPEAPSRMDIDSVNTLPIAPQSPSTAVPPGATGPTGPGGGGPVSPVPVPPTYGITGTPAPAARGTGNPPGGRPVSGPPAAGPQARPGTPPASNGFGRATQSTLPPQGGTATGRPAGPSAGRAPAQGGVTGGRPQPTTGRAGTGVPRGTVMGSESPSGSRGATGARGPSGQPSAGISGRPTATSGGTRGTQGRLSAGATGDKGVVGGRPSKEQRPNSRAFTRGGSGLVRPQGAPGGTSDDRTGAAGRGGTGAAPRGPRGNGRQDDAQSDRPDYVTEDQTTWQPDGRRNVPPVVADQTKNDER
ncbi:hypothetical protein [Streptomyces sp. NPDC046939]|uniref:hypothetical protein n=1 Tax=Streptomyces sp. NPDC046939 TaxID=3155376 RepID=UPI0033CAD8B2